MPQKVPEPFEPFPEPMGFIDHVGPLYWVADKGDFALGFRAEAKHVNPAGIVHGGMLVTAADMTLAIGTRTLAGVDTFLPTIHLNCDFMEPARLGDWIEGRILHMRTEGRTAFATCVLAADGRDLVRASAIMKIPRADDPRFGRRPKPSGKPAGKG